jgi:hypothetical protein
MFKFTFKKPCGSHATVYAVSEAEAAKRLKQSGVYFDHFDCVGASEELAVITEIYVPEYKEVYVKMSEL